MFKTMTRWCLVVAVAASLASCASTPKPLEEMSQSRNAVAQADTIEVREFAPMELLSAKEQQDLAERAFKAEEYTQAKRHSEQAVVQAELATAKAEATKSRMELQQVDGNIKTMQQEVDGTKPSMQLR
jgi:hypothetical protein